jgi:hypothetical protein
MMHWFIIWSTINFLYTDSYPLVKYHRIDFNIRKDAIEFYNNLKHVETVDSIPVHKAGVYYVKLDSIRKLNYNMQNNFSNTSD